MRNNFKKGISVIALLIIVISFIGCGKTNSKNNSSQATTSTNGTKKEEQVKKAPLDALKDLFKSKGFDVGDNQTVDFAMIGATSGYKFTLNGQLVEFYVYEEDKLTDEGKKMFEQAKNGSLDISGFNVKVDYVNNFVIARLDEHKDKDKILDVVKSFKY